MSNNISDTSVNPTFHANLVLTQEQKEFFSKVFYAYRFTYNRYKSEREIYWDDRIRGRKLKPEVKNRILSWFNPTDPYKLWADHQSLKCVPIEVIYSAKEACDLDYAEYYGYSRKGGKKVSSKPPKFKENTSRQTVTIRTRISERIDLDKHTITFPIIGKLAFDDNGAYADRASEFEGARYTSITITRDDGNEYQCSAVLYRGE